MTVFLFSVANQGCVMCCWLSGAMGASLRHSVHLILTLGCAPDMLEAVQAKPIANQTLLSIYPKCA